LASSLNELSERARTALIDIEKRGAIRVQHLSALYGLSDGASAVHAHVGGSGVECDERPSRSFLRWKRLIDAATALIVLVGFFPLMLGVCIAAFLDVGWPVIFWQQRPGAYGRPIRVLKFRTMGPPQDRNGRRLSDIERVSNVGRLLRRLRLDELPQLYNVLLGHMSLVGPRPLLPVDQPSAPAARLRLRPGLTGWAQINGGRHLSSEDKAALDLWYIKNASLILDMRILAHTVHMVLFGERVDPCAVQQAWRALRNDHAALLPVEAIEQNPVC
jgi:lipopolysaccharide/colanic/teichoic acid biosynthesis glycosyltransferase